MGGTRAATRSREARSRDKLIGVYIGILAVVLAVCSMGGGNAGQGRDAQQNIEASNTWAFFQAKNARRQALRLHADEFELMLATDPAMPEDVARRSQIEDCRLSTPRTTSLPATLNARKASTSCSTKGKALEAAARSGADSAIPISITAKRCCRSPSCWRRSPSSRAATCCCSSASSSAGLACIATIGGFTLAFPAAVRDAATKVRAAQLHGCCGIRSNALTAVAATAPSRMISARAS